MAIDISEKEYLFVFSGTSSLFLGHFRMEENFFHANFFRLSGLGIYLDEKGRTSRSREIMFTATPVAVGENIFHWLFHTDIPPHKILLFFVAFSRPNLLIYTETHIAVYDVVSADWIQTINLRRVRFLLRISRCVSYVLEYDKSHHDFSSFSRQDHSALMGAWTWSVWTNPPWPFTFATCNNHRIKSWPATAPPKNPPDHGVLHQPVERARLRGNTDAGRCAPRKWSSPISADCTWTHVLVGLIFHSDISFTTVTVSYLHIIHFYSNASCFLLFKIDFIQIHIWYMFFLKF